MPELITTHSGSFHADDVFGVAVLATLHPQARIVRTRDPQEIARADFAVDVGGVWDAARGRFDHHQRGFDGRRERPGPDGVPVAAEGYASAGLVWQAHGPAYVRQAAAALGEALDEVAAARIAADIDASLVRYLDLVDNGAADVAPGAFGLSSQVAMLNTSWLEEQGLDRAALAQLQLQRFQEAMALVQRLLGRMVLRAVGQRRAAERVRGAERLLDGRVLLLADGGLPWTRVVIEEMPDVRLVLCPEWDGSQTLIRTVPQAPGSFASRMDLPAAWSGLRDAALAAVTGVPDAVFCHTKSFIPAAARLEGALRMAAEALQAQQPAAA